MYNLYHWFIERMAEMKFYTYLKGCVQIHRSLSYNTYIQITIRTSVVRFPRWQAIIKLSPRYDWHGNRTRKICWDCQHSHWGINNHVWHNVLTRQEKDELVKERKFRNFVLSVW